MRNIKRRHVALAAMALAWAIVGTANAQSIDRRTYFEFTGPVSVPGVTLPAGKYIFLVQQGAAQHDVLQVLSANGKTSFAQFFAWRAQRTESVPTPELRFMETGPGVAPAIKSWWHPSELAGYEFIYPRAQAQMLARGTGHPVLTTREEAIAPEPPALTLVGPTGEEEPVVAPVPYTPELPVVTGVPAPEMPQLARAELPRTASADPLVLLGGLAFLLAAAVLGGVRMALR